MIKIDDRYFIEADNLQWILKKTEVITKSPKKESIGKIGTRQIGYYRSLDSVIQAYVNEIGKEIASGDEVVELKDFMGRMDDLAEDVRERLSNL